jgi:hypothetical protein
LPELPEITEEDENNELPANEKNLGDDLFGKYVTAQDVVI